MVPPYSNPINYKGQYHYRSGSTKQELKGASLNKFLLERGGIHWDEYVVPNVKVKKMLGVSRATAMRLLRKMDGVLEPVGQGAGSYYRIRNY